MFGIILSIGTVAAGLMYLKNQNQTQIPDINAQFCTIVYNLIYVFSFLQIKCIKGFKYLSDIVSRVSPMVSIEIRGDNKAYIISQKYKNGNKMKNEAESDLVIIKENELSLVINPLTNQDPCINIIESNVRFIAITMIYNGERYKLSLKTPEYNFYVIGNKIDKSFLQYYLVNILFIPFLNETESELKDESEVLVEDESEFLVEDEYKTRKFEYILEVMDNDVNYIYLNETQYILLDLDNYSLH
jgi:hypothetical protein